MWSSKKVFLTGPHQFGQHSPLEISPIQAVHKYLDKTSRSTWLPYFSLFNFSSSIFYFLFRSLYFNSLLYTCFLFIISISVSNLHYIFLFFFSHSFFFLHLYLTFFLHYQSQIPARIRYIILTTLAQTFWKCFPLFITTRIYFLEVLIIYLYL